MGNLNLENKGSLAKKKKVVKEPHGFRRMKVTIPLL